MRAVSSMRGFDRCGGSSHGERVVHVGELLSRNARERPDRIALRGDAETTFGDLDARARRIASALSPTPGEVIALHADSSEAALAAWFGVVYGGGIVLPLPKGSTTPEIVARMTHARARRLLVDAPTLGIESLMVADLGRGADELREMRRSPDGTAMLLYTSATTGAPKAACIGHDSLVAHCTALAEDTLGLRRDDVVLGALPLAHSFGIRMTVLAPFAVGASCALVSRGARFDAARCLEVAAKEGVTWLPGVPTMFSAWGDVLGAPWPELRWCLSAGAPLSEEVRQRAERRLGAEVRQGYGLTEASFIAIDAPPSPIAPGTCGKPTAGVEVRVREGELEVRGVNLMSGYMDDEAANAETFDTDGWLHTGDLGRLDEEGRVVVLDRRTDLILRGGHNVYPSEVESVLATHPSVAAVAVVGRSDARLGEEVVAVLVPREAIAIGQVQIDLVAIDLFVRARLAATKVPREYAIVDALPLGPSRKILKRALRARIEAGSLATLEP